MRPHVSDLIVSLQKSAKEWVQGLDEFEQLIETAKTKLSGLEGQQWEPVVSYQTVKQRLVDHLAASNAYLKDYHKAQAALNDYQEVQEHQENQMAALRGEMADAVAEYEADTAAYERLCSEIASVSERLKLQQQEYENLHNRLNQQLRMFQSKLDILCNCTNMYGLVVQKTDSNESLRFRKLIRYEISSL